MATTKISMLCSRMINAEDYILKAKSLTSVIDIVAKLQLLYSTGSRLGLIIATSVILSSSCGMSALYKQLSSGLDNFLIYSR